MPEVRLPYGKTEIAAALPADWPVDVIAPVEVPAAEHPAESARRALEQPLGGVRLADYTGVRSVAVAISDKTRPIPHEVIYALLDKLEELGIPPEAITFLLATGTHAPMPVAEFTMVLPDDILSRYRVVSHDCDNRASLVYLGDTLRGTPVWANRQFVEAGLRIVIGNIEPHQFMGFSGGVKSTAIGLAGRVTINRNHQLMRDPRSTLGTYDDNPARQDVEDIGCLFGDQVALNTVLNAQKQIVRVLAGDPVAVVRAGIPLVRELNEVQVAAPCDLVIASPGGHPKDINVYQSQKALAHATRITKPGGTIIVVAECPEGAGSQGYERWIEGMESHDAVLDRFAREGFELGPHKAFQIARDSRHHDVRWVSTLSGALAQRLLLNSQSELNPVLADVLRRLEPGAHIGVMPAANATVPVLAQPG